MCVCCCRDLACTCLRCFAVSCVHVFLKFCCLLTLSLALLPSQTLIFRTIDSFQNQSGFSGRHRGGTLDPAAVRTANLGISVLHPNTLWGLAEAP